MQNFLLRLFIGIICLQTTALLAQQTDNCQAFIPEIFPSVSNEGYSAMQIEVQEVSYLKMVIFSNKGQKVFDVSIDIDYLPEEVTVDGQHRKIIDSGWDAKLLGNVLNTGLYTFIVDAVCEDGEKARFKVKIRLMEKTSKD